MFNTRALSLFGLGLLLAASHALGAPLQLVSSRVEAKISGSAPASARSAAASYSATSYSTGVWNCQLADSVATTPALPGAPVGTAASLAGVRIEQPAANEFIFTLSSKSSGSCQPGAAPAVTSAYYRADAFAGLSAFINIEPYAGHDVGAPATIYITVEHLGDMSSTNGAYTTNYAYVGLSGTQYNKTLTLIPPQDPGDFADLNITARRDASVSTVLQGAVGQSLCLSATFRTAVDQGQSQASARRASAADFEDGLRIHLTVMPEPGAACLGLLGAGLLLRRRRP